MSAAQHLTRHSALVDADVDSVYRLVENVSDWPAIFGPTVHVHPLTRSGNRERFRIWATVNGRVRSWISGRTLDREHGIITFEQERPSPPLAGMGGRWEFRAAPYSRTEVVLHHHFATVDDGQDSVAMVSRALYENSTAELAALARVTGTGYPVTDILFTFRHRVTANGSVADAYDFIHDAGQWPARLPHVAHTRLVEREPGVQELQMVARSPGGQTHTSESVRVCFKNKMIAYKQLVLPIPLIGHSGRWTFGSAGSGVVIESEHTVLLDPNRTADALGASVTIGDARMFVRAAIERNNRVTLLHAKEFTERARIEPTSGHLV